MNAGRWVITRALLGTEGCCLRSRRLCSASFKVAECEPDEFTSYLDSLTNYEKLGVPERAGTDCDEGLDLGRMRRLLECLDNPQSKFKAVHIAGTKGKGSTAAFIASILRSEGYSVGCYTSPHLLSIRERMTFSATGDAVSADELTSLFYKIRHKLDEAIRNEHGILTHFEVLTATAFSMFAENNVDIAVVEAGLGGARDATNVFDDRKLALSVITTIGEEHLLALGGSLESIALSKAGIIKNGRPVILGGPFLPHIEHILREKAAAMCSPVMSAYDAGIKSTISETGVINGCPFQSCDVKIQDEARPHMSLELPDVKLRMLGRHQLQNALSAACAALSLRDQGWKISNESIRTGLESSYLPGRFQLLSAREAEVCGIIGASLLLDGAHTKDSAKAMAETVKAAFPDAQVILVVAMADDKDHSAFARELLLGLRHLVAVFLTEVHIAGGKYRSASATSLKEHWANASRRLGINASEASSEKVHSDSLKTRRVEIVTANCVEECIVSANVVLSSLSGNRPKLIVVTGSLHAVASVLSLRQK